MLLGSWSLTRVLIGEDPTARVRRGKEETVEDRWAMTVVKIMLLVESPNWGKLSDRHHEATVGKVGESQVTCGSQGLYVMTCLIRSTAHCIFY